LLKGDHKRSRAIVLMATMVDAWIITNKVTKRHKKRTKPTCSCGVWA